MEQLIHPTNTTLYNLFADTTSFCIPNYQRSYAWEPHNIEMFWEDIFYCATQRFEKQTPYKHFFGQMLLYRKERTATNLERYEVIDGQQRITTFSLLCIAIAKKLKSIISEPGATKKIKESANRIYSEIYNKIVYYTVYSPPVIRLQLQRSDEVFFQALVAAIINNSADGTIPATVSQRLFKNALYMFIEKLDSLGYNSLKFIEFAEALTKSASEDCLLIGLTVEKKIGLQHVFTTVNDRGLVLTTGELLKAKTIETLNGFDELQNEAEDIWNTILGDDSLRAERYLEYYFISLKGTLDSKKSLYNQFVKDIFTICQKRKIVTSEANAFLEQIRKLKSGIEVIAKLDKGEWPYVISANSPCLWRRNRLKILTTELKCKSVIALFLASYIHLDEDRFYKIVALSELNYFNTISVNSPNRYSKFTDMVYKEAKAICDRGAAYATTNFKDAFVSFRAREHYDDNFERKINEIEYKKSKSNTTTRYFLYMMELYYSSFNSTGYVEPDDAINIDFTTLSTEHIYSAELPLAEQNADLELHKNRIGNLCPLGKKYNSRLGNKTFAQKKSKYLAAGYKTTNYIATLPDWTKAEYDRLSSKYLHMARELFVENKGL